MAMGWGPKIANMWLDMQEICRIQRYAERTTIDHFRGRLRQ